MVNFYFIDTNLLIGYCNPLDYFHHASKEFFQEKDPRRTILLPSIKEEFYRKIVEEQALFHNHILKSYKSVNLPSISDIENIISKKKKLREANFIKHIVDLVQNGRVKEISYENSLEIFHNYISRLKKEFSELVSHWIKRPHVRIHDTILQDKIFINFYNIFTSLPIHDPDAEHLSAACFEIRWRNRNKPTHEYYFYTTDKGWVKHNLGKCSGLHNFHVKLLPYKEDCKLKWSNDTQSLSIKVVDKTIYLPDGL